MIIKKQLNYSLILAIAAFLLCLPILLFDNLPVRDVVNRYAPMAEAFAQGNWQDAFQPKIPPLFVIVSGTFSYLFRVNGTVACELGSALFFALTVFPLMALMKKVYNYKYAFWATAMYILSSRLLRIAGMGLRDPAKCFFIVLAACGLIYFFQKRNWRGAVYCSLGGVGLTLTRGDSLPFALLFLAAIFIIELFNEKKIPYKSICAVLIFCAAVSPWVCYEYQKTGWPVTEQRQAMVLNRIFGYEDSKETIYADNTALPVDLRNKENIKEFWKNLFKGLCPQYLLFIIPVLIYRIRKKTLSSEEWILLAAIFIHTFGMIGQIAIADKRLFIYKRYLIVATPLTYGWAAIGLRWLFDKTKKLLKLKHRWVATAILIGAAVIFVFNAWSRIRKGRINPYLYQQVNKYTGMDLKK
ncbi:MAG: phospholipid carrier-dependent glycosyltransferase [Victivallaceae bacterium]